MFYKVKDIHSNLTKVVIDTTFVDFEGYDVVEVDSKIKAHDFVEVVKKSDITSDTKVKFINELKTVDDLNVTSNDEHKNIDTNEVV